MTLVGLSIFTTKEGDHPLPHILFVPPFFTFTASCREAEEGKDKVETFWQKAENKRKDSRPTDQHLVHGRSNIWRWNGRRPKQSGTGVVTVRQSGFLERIASAMSWFIKILFASKVLIITGSRHAPLIKEVNSTLPGSQWRYCSCK